MSKWISVKDRLPENEIPVLLKLKNKIVISDKEVGYYRNGKPFVISSVFTFSIPEVIGWMDLPE